MNNTKNQHFVPRMYLKGWVNSNGKIYAVNDGEASFKKFMGLKGVGYLHYCYRLLPISLKEMALIYTSIDKMPEFMHEKMYNLIGPICEFCLRKTTFEDSLLSTKMDFVSNNVIEKLFGFSETDVGGYFINLRNGDTSFWKNKSERLSVVIFICFQFHRTPKRKLDALNSMNSMKDEYQNCWPILQIVLALSLAYSSEWKLTMLINNANESFITSDNPTILLDRVKDVIPTNNKIYMPISPKYAIIVEDNQIQTAENVVEKEVQEEEVVI